MRLLDSRTLELVDVRDDDIPRYAILSHTWDDDEVTLEEMRHMQGYAPPSFSTRKKSIADRKGYAKIVNAAAMALKRGLAYLWVDTCCIDKTSSSELSEAINSMYLWYKQAAECYAILSDVAPAIPFAPDALSDVRHSPHAQPLRSSRWFTRGWTLQELIAPTDMHFFARDWSPLGQKHKPSSFTEILSEVTGIEIEVLDGRVDPAQLSVATRMKWASHRKTTRLEDTAYCLMGLFQVNMPLLYGEGARAFARLQEQIIQSTDDQTLFAWTSTSRPDKTEDADDPDALCGLLASCPTDFQQAGGMQSLPPLPVYASAPSTMTNLGLRVQLYLRPIHDLEGVPMEEDFYAILDSVVRVDETYLCPAITLRKLSVDQFARLRNRPHKFLVPVQSQLASEGEGYRTVYVRQNPVYYNLPQIRVSPLHSMTSGIPVNSSVFRTSNPPLITQQPSPTMPRFKLVDAFPSARWNPNTLTMGVRYSRKLEVMALFRFQDTTSSTFFDVVLGLRRLDRMQWKGWCFQLSQPKGLLSLPALATVFKNTNERIKRLIFKSKRGVVSSTALRESLGDDPHLMSDAIVSSVQQQGRLYLSLSVSLRLCFETCGESVDELRARQIQLDVEDELRRPPKIHTPKSRFKDLSEAARHLTEPFETTLQTLFEEPGESTIISTSVRRPVRGRPKTSPLDIIRTHLDISKTYLGQHKGWTAAATVRLALAANAGDLDGMASLQPSRELINSVTSDAYGLTILHWAMAGGHESTIKYLLEKGARIHGTAKYGLSILHIMALFWGGVGKDFILPKEALDHRLATSVTTDFYQDAPLHLAAACQTNDPRRAQILRQIAFAGYVAPRNALDETPIHRAAALNNPQVINTLTPLLPQSVNYVDRYGRSPLWHAAATGSKEAIDALLALGASVNLPDDMGISPLHAACRGGYVECMVVLLKAGADPCSKTVKLDLTPIDLAVMFGHHRILDICLGNAPYAGAWHGTRPTQEMLDRCLHIASSCGELECVKSLIWASADPWVSFDYHFDLSKKIDNIRRFEVVDFACNSREVARGFWQIEQFIDAEHKRRLYISSLQPTNRLLVLDNPPGAYWHPDHGAAGRYFFELQGEAIDKATRSLNHMHNSEAPDDFPPLVYVGNPGFEKYKRLPSGGFAYSGQAEMAEALRLQNWRIRRGVERGQGESTTEARTSAQDTMAQALRLCTSEDAHGEPFTRPEAFANEEEKLPPPLVYVGADEHFENQRWVGGGLGLTLNGNVTTSGESGDGNSDEDDGLDHIRDAHMFRAVTLGQGQSGWRGN